MIIHINKFESPLSNNVLCQVELKFTLWIWRIPENLTDVSALPTHHRYTVMRKLRSVFISGGSKSEQQENNALK